MAIIKAYTTIEQSRKLAEILPLESVDMFHFIHEVDTVGFGYKKDAEEFYSKTEFEYIPCWSLAALLNVIPKHIKDYNVLRTDISENDTSIWYDEIGYGVNNNLPDITMEYAVDACYEMIIRLNELNLL